MFLQNSNKVFPDKEMQGFCVR